MAFDNEFHKLQHDIDKLNTYQFTDTDLNLATRHFVDTAYDYTHIVVTHDQEKISEAEDRVQAAGVTAAENMERVLDAGPHRAVRRDVKRAWKLVSTIVNRILAAVFPDLGDFD